MFGITKCEPKIEKTRSVWMQTIVSLGVIGSFTMIPPVGVGVGIGVIVGAGVIVMDEFRQEKKRDQNMTKLSTKNLPLFYSKVWSNFYLVQVSRSRYH